MTGTAATMVFFFQAEDGIRDYKVTGVQTCALPISTGWNTSRYANARVDALVEQARRSLNQTEREKLYGEVQDIIAKEMVWIPVYTTKEIIATRGNVKGFQIHPVEYNLALWKTWLDR